MNHHKFTNNTFLLARNLCASFVILFSFNLYSKHASHKEVFQTHSLREKKDGIEVEITTPTNKELKNCFRGMPPYSYAAKKITIHNHGNAAITLYSKNIHSPLVKAKKISRSLHHNVIGRAIATALLAPLFVASSLAAYWALNSGNRNDGTNKTRLICGVYVGIPILSGFGAVCSAIGATRASLLNKETDKTCLEHILDKTSALTIYPKKSITKYLFTRKKMKETPLDIDFVSAEEGKTTSFILGQSDITVKN